MNEYLKLKERHQKEFSDFPMFFAFNSKQFAEELEKFGLKPDEVNKLYKTNYGGFYKKTDSMKLKVMMDRHTKEMKDAIAADKVGNGFILDMFNYELSNHEYSYTFDDTDTLAALGLSIDDINENLALAKGLADAKITQQSD